MAEVNPAEVSAILKQQLSGFESTASLDEVGSVLTVGDGIALVDGLDGVMVSELLEFSNGVYGMALNLEENHVGVVIMGNDQGIKEGDKVKRTGRVVEVPVGDHIWEIDIFHGENKGLVVAEIELSSEAEEFDIPAWATDDVTEDPKYYNSNLLLNPYRKWGST